MQMIARYPVSNELIEPHVGRPVVAMLHDGEMVCGVIDRVHDGHLFLKPVHGVPEATIQSVKKSMKKSVGPVSKRPEKLQTKAFAGGFGGYPYGYGYGNFGWGAGWWWIFPLFLLTALATVPFFW